MYIVYTAVLQATVGASRAQTAAAANRLAEATGLPPPSEWSQARLFAHARMRPNMPSPANTAGQPSDAAASRPMGAPSESDIRRPDTATASQVARRSGRAAVPISA